MTEHYHDLTADQIKALSDFACAHGMGWKLELSMTYWYNARLWRGRHGTDNMVGSILHGLRNSHGPDWLDTYPLAHWAGVHNLPFPMARGRSLKVVR